MYNPQMKNFIKEADSGCFNGTYEITCDDDERRPIPKIVLNRNPTIERPNTIMAIIKKSINKSICIGL